MSKYDKDAFRAHGAMSTSKTNDAHLTSAQVVEILLNPDDPKQVLPNLFKKIAGEQVKVGQGAEDFDAYYNECWLEAAGIIYAKWGPENPAGLKGDPIVSLAVMVRTLSPVYYQSVESPVRQHAIAHTTNVMHPSGYIPNSGNLRKALAEESESWKEHGQSVFVSFDYNGDDEDEGGLREVEKEIYDSGNYPYELDIDAEIDKVAEVSIAKKRLQTLKKEQMELLYLRVGQGHSWAKVADLLQVTCADPEDSVQQRWRRFEPNFKKLMDGISLPAIQDAINEWEATGINYSNELGAKLTEKAKTYDLGELSELYGMSREDVTQVIQTYQSKG